MAYLCSPSRPTLAEHDSMASENSMALTSSTPCQTWGNDDRSTSGCSVASSRPRSMQLNLDTTLPFASSSPVLSSSSAGSSPTSASNFPDEPVTPLATTTPVSIRSYPVILESPPTSTLSPPAVPKMLETG